MDNVRPVFLNLLQFRFPVTAIVSIGHRFSGLLMVLMIPVLIAVLDMSTRPEGYAQLTEWLNSFGVRVGLFLIIWAFAHHFFAGIRFLLLDLDLGIDKNTAVKSAWLVHLAAAGTAIFSIIGLIL